MLIEFFKALFRGRRSSPKIRCSNEFDERTSSKLAHDFQLFDHLRCSRETVNSKLWWTQTHYNAPGTIHAQHQLNMMYAPAVYALTQIELPSMFSSDELSFGSPFFDSTPSISLQEFEVKRSANQILNEISTHPVELVRMCVAENSATPEIGLRALAQDPSNNVKLALINNPNCPDDVLRTFVGDRSPVISFEAVCQIRRGWPRAVAAS